MLFDVLSVICFYACSWQCSHMVTNSYTLDLNTNNYKVMHLMVSKNISKQINCFPQQCFQYLPSKGLNINCCGRIQETTPVKGLSRYEARTDSVEYVIYRELCTNAGAQGTIGQISKNTRKIPVQRSRYINSVSGLYPLQQSLEIRSYVKMLVRRVLSHRYRRTQEKFQYH